MTTSPAEVAIDRLQWLADHSPDAWRLARLASAAVRVEPYLLRRLRLELLPDADVGTEADLWFSPVVEAQGVDAIVLDAHAADLLRNDLAGDPDLFRRALGVIESAHESLPAALRLEERINAIALIAGAAATSRIDDELRAAIRAMTESGERAGEIARWVMRAWPRLHETVRSTPAAATLALAASTLLRRRLTADPMAANARLTELSWILPSIEFTRWIDLGVELRDGALHFVNAGTGADLRVPDTRPPLVELEWRVGGETYVRVVDAVAGRVVDLHGSTGEVRMGTLDGAAYVATRAPDDSVGLHAHAEPVWLDLSSVDAVADACVRVAPSDSGAEPAWSTAFYIDPRTLATARWPLEGQERIRIQPVAGPDTVEIVEASIGDDILLIEPAAGSAHTEPVRLATPPMHASAGEAGGGLQLRGTRVVILGHDGDTLRAVEGLARVSDLEGREFAVTLDLTRLPAGFVGGPVVADDRVRGLVVSIETREPSKEGQDAGAAVVCHVAGARAIVDAHEAILRQRAARRARETQSASAEQVALSDIEMPGAAESVQAQATHDVAQESAPHRPRDADGARFAKVIVVGDGGAGMHDLIRALANPETSQRIDDRITIAWIERRTDVSGPGSREATRNADVPLPAGLVFQESTSDRRWPIEIDLEKAALALIVAGEESGADSAAAWERRIRNAAPALPILVVGGRDQRDVDGVRASIIERIDWSAQPRVEPRAFEAARSTAARTLSARPPIEGGTTLKPGDPAAGWHRELTPLTGERRVADDIVIRDPSLFESLVLAIIEIADKRFNNVPAARIEEVARRWPELTSRWKQLGGYEVDPSEVVRGVVAELERLKLAVAVRAANTEVVAIPSIMEAGFVSRPDSSATRILSANWTGEAREILLRLVVQRAWEQGGVRALGWDPASNGGAALLVNPDLCIQAEQSDATARLTFLAQDPDARREAPRLAHELRAQVELLVRGNASLSFEEGEGRGHMA